MKGSKIHNLYIIYTNDGANPRGSDDDRCGEYMGIAHVCSNYCDAVKFLFEEFFREEYELIENDLDFDNIESNDENWDKISQLSGISINTIKTHVSDLKKYCVDIS